MLKKILKTFAVILLIIAAIGGFLFWTMMEIIRIANEEEL